MAVLTALGIRATITPLTARMVRIHLVPADDPDSTDGAWWFESTSMAAVESLQRLTPVLVELVGNRLAAAGARQPTTAIPQVSSAPSAIVTPSAAAVD